MMKNSTKNQIVDLKNASPESIRNLQLKLMEILFSFQKVCNDNELTYYFCGGCAIGAKRHQGFIPWDDDVDILMPREDYEKLHSIWERENLNENLLYCRTNSKQNFHHGGASIRDISTTFINKHSVDEDICHGVGIELMPIDGCPKSKISRLKQLYNASLFGVFNTQRLPDNKGLAVRVITYCLYNIFRKPSTRIKIWQHAEKEMSKYTWDDCDEVTELIGSIKGMLLRHPKEWFASMELYQFETSKFPLMKGANRYLNLIFGDYMELPPEEKRVAKHDVEYIDLERSYLEYKGVYYCKE